MARSTGNLTDLSCGGPNTIGETTGVRQDKENYMHEIEISYCVS
jgi:hypothetical protein